MFGPFLDFGDVGGRKTSFSSTEGDETFSLNVIFDWDALRLEPHLVSYRHHYLAIFTDVSRDWSH